MRYPVSVAESLATSDSPSATGVYSVSIIETLTVTELVTGEVAGGGPIVIKRHRRPFIGGGVGRMM